MKNKKGTIQFLLVGFFLVSIFFGVSVFSDTVLAQDAASSAAAEAGVRNGDSVLEDDGMFTTGAKYLLYAILVILIKFVQVAASVFTWATQPAYISGDTGLLNLDSVYTLWKFIRDFFNLFFIFLLLFSAFATVFQIEQYGIKKNFVKIIAAAIAINFSFPLTRIIIDLGNVPMYFFAQGLTSLSGNGNALQGIPQAFFQSSGITEIGLLPNPGSNGTLIPLLTGVIFMFIFMITLFVLALLFVMRLLTLVVLLIFSPLGVAASIIPGLAKYGKDWWSSLLKNVFFGPAAMLMVVIALRFTLELNGGAANTGTTFAQGLGGTAPAQNNSSQSSVIAQGVFFIPIVLMWMAMHAGSKFGIVGASEVMKRADKVAAWGKKAALGTGKWAASPVTTRAKGAYAGSKERLYEGRLFGDKIKKMTGGRLGTKAWKEGGEAAEARAKGFMSKGFEGAKKAERKHLKTKAAEQLKKWKDEGFGAREAIAKLEKDENGKFKASDTEVLAAANFLASEKDAMKKAKPADLETALMVANSIENKDLHDKLVSAASDDSLELSGKQLRGLEANYVEANTKKGDSLEKIADARKDFQEGMKYKMKKEGKMNYFLDYKVEAEFLKNNPTKTIADLTDTERVTIKTQLFTDENVLNMSAKDMAKQKELLVDENFQKEVIKQGTWNRDYANRVAKFISEDEGNKKVKLKINGIEQEVNTLQEVQNLADRLPTKNSGNSKKKDSGSESI